MGEYTKNLQLYKADTLEDGNDTFNINRMLNDNWDKIDEMLKKLPVQNGGWYINDDTTEEDKAEALKSINGFRHEKIIYGDEFFGNDIDTWFTAGIYNTNQMVVNTPCEDGYGTIVIFGSQNRTVQWFFAWNGEKSGMLQTRYKNYDLDWTEWKSFLPLDGSVPMSGELKYYDGSKTLAYPVPMSNAGFHNSVYRGKYLGTAVTDTQWTAIGNGTFEDLYIGDYWTIGGINYRIAAFDYYYRTGDTSCDTHHVVLVPDVIMYTHVMNDTNITDGAYVGSKMYTEGLTQAKTTINNAFGSAHILNHRQLLCNATANGYESGHAWYDSTVELMTEQNVYGCKIFGNQTNGTGWAYNYTIDKSQYPLFTFRPDMISNRQWFWLRDVASAALFAYVASHGLAYALNASDAIGVRPAFSIC